MPVEHSPPGDVGNRDNSPRAYEIALPKLAVLRGRRTRQRSAIMQEWRRVQHHSAAIESERRELINAAKLVDERIDRMQKLDDQICAHPLLPDDEHDREVTESEDAANDGLIAKCGIATLLDQDQPNQRYPEASPAASTNGNRDGSSPAAAVSSVPPPFTGGVVCTAAPSFLDVTPEVFDGRASGYRIWRAQLKNYLDRRNNASDTDKLVALSKYLRGSPKQLVSALPLVDSNYKVALELLDQNYAASGVEEKAIIASVMVVPTVKHPGDITSMRDLVNTTQRAILSMQAAGIPLEDYAIMYEVRVRSALPASTLFDFEERERHMAPAEDGSSATADAPRPAQAAAKRLTALLDSLRRLVCLREQLTASGQQQSNGYADAAGRSQQGGVRRQDGAGASGGCNNRYPPRQRQNYTVAPALLGGRQRPHKPKPPQCVFCKSSEHRPSRCSADLTYGQRCEILAKLQRCAVCFRYQHGSSRDCEGPKAACAICNKRDHYTAMHQPQNNAVSTQQTTVQGVHAVVPSRPDQTVATPVGLVMTASVMVVHGSQRIAARVFLDTGSMLTFVKPQLIDQLSGIRPRERAELELQAFASKHTVTSNRYKLRLESVHNASTKISLFAYAHDFQIEPPDGSVAMREAIRRFAADHPLADPAVAGNGPSAEVVLLVGIDQFYKLVYVNQEKEISDGLVAKNSRIGWLIGGAFKAQSTRGDVRRIVPVCCAATLSKPAKDIERLWSLEAFGVSDPDGPSEGSMEEHNALQQFKQSVTNDGQSYQVAVPRRESIVTLDNNLTTARNRLASKRRSLLRDLDTFRRYDAELMAFVRDGFAREVARVDVMAPSSQDGTYYMPHQSVITSGENGQKWRIVFDCSASAPGTKSLNAHLLPGPNLNPDIVALLMNFRAHRIALSTDIAKAYMTLRLAEADWPLFRFLWQGPEDSSPRVYEMQRVTWGATPSGFLLAAVLREHFKRVDPEGVYRLDKSIYFDDLLIGFATEDEAAVFVDRITKWMDSAGMGLVKWKSNSPNVLRHLEQTGQATSIATSAENKLLKVLGIAWDPAVYEFQFQFARLVDTVANLQRVTKRMVLRVVAAVYDPLGWLVPFTLRGKLIIRQLWSQTLRWDESIDGQTVAEFRAWAEEIGALTSLRIPRWYGTSSKTPIAHQLHVFGDASEKAFAAAAYVQMLYADGGSQCTFLMAKSRVAPREKISLPRLELMAALLAARLRDFIVKRLQMQFDRIVHYTDSAVTYYWCTGEEPARWKMFVCNRVKEIRQLTSPDEWFHVTGASNIADIATRGTGAADLVRERRWWFGPSWLADSEGERPVSRLQCGSNKMDSLVEELRMVVAPAVVVPSVVDLDRFGSWEAAIRVVSRVLLFTQRCRRQPPQSDAALRSAAERYLIRAAQWLHFRAEIAAVRAEDALPRASKLNAFRLFLGEDGLLRARTRLTQGTQLTFDERNPVVIPGDSRLATLLILHHHRLNAHLGVGAVLNALRRRFWVLRGRQVVKTLLRGCVVCRRAHGQAADQVQAPLPVERVSLDAPFATTGVDFCGPFYTRSKEGTSKNYVALFTCASVRAIHIELIPDMSTPRTHLALRRFLAIYPACRRFISDNGRSFVRAAADIKRLFNSFREPEARELLAQRRIEWTFTCPRAPWRNGFTERMVGVVKAALSRTLGRSLISAEELQTILTEIAAVINDRPLTYVCTDADESRALTPAMFLRGGPSVNPLCAVVPLDRLGPDGCIPTDPPEAERLRRALLARTSYFRALSVRWFREYLLQLRSAHIDRTGRARALQDGEVCLLREDNAPRVRWNLVRVVEGHPGRDGAVRTYTVKFANGHESRRAAQLLIPLECADADRPRMEE